MRQESNHRMNSGAENRLKMTNSRALGILVLIALLFVFQVATFIVHKLEAPDQEKRFHFNPNTITLDSLRLLGLSERQGQSILNYRSKGGKFRKKSDFAKMYVVDSVMYSSLAPYILLPDSIVPVSTKTGPGQGAKKEYVKTRETVVSSGKAPLQRNAKDSIYGRKVERNRYMCNLNTADSAALVRLYGIGGYYARKILKYREQLGGSFVSPRQLLEIDGFTQERYSKIEKSIFVREEDIKGFSLLNAERSALERHPYIGPYAARGIVTYLRVKGRPAENALSSRAEIELSLLKELVKERILTPENARKLEEYLLYL